MNAWFEDEKKLNALSSGERKASEERKESPTDSPTSKDFDEATDWLEIKLAKNTKKIRYLFGGAGVLAFVFSTFVHVQNMPITPIFSAILFLFVSAISIALAQNLQTKIHSESPKASIGDLSLTLSQTASTTFWVALIVIITLPLFILPGLYALFSLVRAPYLAAQGDSPFEALKHSYAQRLDFPKAHLELTITIINALLSIAFMILLFEIVGPLIPWGLENLVFYLVMSFILSGIWIHVFAINIVAEAFSHGIIDDQNLVKHRKPASLFSFFNSTISKLSPFLILVIFVVLSQKKGEDPKGSSPTQIQWTMEKMGGDKVSSETYGTKPIVLYAWAPWCLPCKIQIPHMKKLYEQKGEEYHVLSVALSYKTRKKVDDYQDTFGLPYPIFYGTNAFQEVAKVSVFPTVMIIQDSKIIRKWTGITSASSIRRSLDDLQMVAK